jgi:hypothetical protein
MMKLLVLVALYAPTAANSNPSTQLVASSLYCDPYWDIAEHINTVDDCAARIIADGHLGGGATWQCAPMIWWESDSRRACRCIKLQSNPVVYDESLHALTQGGSALRCSTNGAMYSISGAPTKAPTKVPTAAPTMTIADLKNSATNSAPNLLKAGHDALYAYTDDSKPADIKAGIAKLKDGHNITNVKDDAHFIDAEFHYSAAVNGFTAKNMPLMTIAMKLRYNKVLELDAKRDTSVLAGKTPYIISAKELRHHGKKASQSPRCSTTVPYFANGVKGAKVVGKGPHGSQDEELPGSVVPIECNQGCTAAPQGSYPLVFMRCDYNTVSKNYTWVSYGECKPPPDNAKTCNTDPSDSIGWLGSNPYIATKCHAKCSKYAKAKPFICHGPHCTDRGQYKRADLKMQNAENKWIPYPDDLPCPKNPCDLGCGDSDTCVDLRQGQDHRIFRLNKRVGNSCTATVTHLRLNTHTAQFEPSTENGGKPYQVQMGCPSDPQDYGGLVGGWVPTAATWVSLNIKHESSRKFYNWRINWDYAPNWTGYMSDDTQEVCRLPQKALNSDAECPKGYYPLQGDSWERKYAASFEGQDKNQYKNYYVGQYKSFQFTDAPTMQECADECSKRGDCIKFNWIPSGVKKSSPNMARIGGLGKTCVYFWSNAIKAAVHQVLYDPKTGKYKPQNIRGIWPKDSPRIQCIRNNMVAFPTMGLAPVRDS